MSKATDSQLPNAEQAPSEKDIEQAKAARENVSEGYGSAVKSRLISGKPDGDTDGGPGVNNANANAPVKR
jgi:hypothetical protein